MIVKFHPRGRGGGSGPVDYLLGKDRQRDGATVLQGKSEEVRELIDASPCKKPPSRSPNTSADTVSAPTPTMPACHTISANISNASLWMAN